MSTEDPKSAFAPATGCEPWISTNDRLPEDGQTVAFVCKHYDWAPDNGGRVLGGRFVAGRFGGFTVPGLMTGADFWMPLPDAPRFHNDKPSGRAAENGGVK